jgi:hypothetical protein
MTKRLRLLLLGFAAMGSLAFSCSALAAFTPTMSVSAKPARTSATGVTSIRVTVPRDDDALARIQIFAPSGYNATFGQAIGAEVGSVTAQVQVREPIAGAVLPITGTIVVADPVAVAAAVTLCTGRATHSALWVLVLSAAGQELRVPVAVDAAAGPTAAFASFITTICLPNPNIPVAAGGATFGAKLINAQLNIRNVFATPAGDGDHVWRAIATPWPNGPGAPVAANTREARAHIILPAVVTVNARAARKIRGFRTVTISGSAREGTSSLSGASVRIQVGNAVKTVRTGANGAYRTTFRLRAGRRYTAAARLTVGERTASAPCSTAGPFQAGTPAIPCATETLPFYEPVTDPLPAADGTFLSASRAFRVR